MYLPRLVFVFILTLCLPTFADNTGAQQKPLNTTHLEQLIGKKTLQESALSAQWQALLYYRKAWFKNQYQSEIEDKKFFISKQGEKNPYAELLTSINAMINLDQNTDSSFSCRFPARAFWIRSTFSGARIELPLATCPKFEQWRQAVSAKGASVIFPAAYLDSPSSMFGHTLIRLDKKSSDGSNNRNALLDYTVSYAAEKKPTDSELAFVYKGLVGGYPGITSVRPYYQKLKEYSDIESRDIWEYTLDISPNETAQLVRHIWEIQNIDIDYYFFTETALIGY